MKNPYGKKFGEHVVESTWEVKNLGWRKFCENPASSLKKKKCYPFDLLYLPVLKCVFQQHRLCVELSGMIYD